MTDDELIGYFESGTMPPGGFHHAEHVRAAWIYLRREPWTLALDRFRTALRRFADAQNASSIYHETITTAFVLLINERLDGADRDLDWDAFARKHADLLAWKPSVLDAYYDRATLDSERARRVFILPRPSGQRAAGAPLK